VAPIDAVDSDGEATGGSSGGASSREGTDGAEAGCGERRGSAGIGFGAGGVRVPAATRAGAGTADGTGDQPAGSVRSISTVGRRREVTNVTGGATSIAAWMPHAARSETANPNRGLIVSRCSYRWSRSPVWSENGGMGYPEAW
jgi:hypothetical protein